MNYSNCDICIQLCNQTSPEQTGRKYSEDMKNAPEPPTMPKTKQNKNKKHATGVTHPMCLENNRKGLES